MRYCAARRLQRPRFHEVSRQPRGSARRLAGERITRHPEVSAVNVNDMVANAFAIPMAQSAAVRRVLGGTTRGG
jgi:hypothetical protein